jgi:hypothetical protein
LNGAKKRVGRETVALARNADPTDYLRARGFAVVWDPAGRHAEVKDDFGDEVYRITRKSDGHFVCCDRYSNPVGRYSGNIDLVIDLEGVTFQEAVARLLEGDRPGPAAGPAPGPKRRPSPPTVPAGAAGDKWIGGGRDYLIGRGISPATIKEAESQGFLGYAADGVFFLGRDENGDVRNAAWRSNDPKAQTPKRDLSGSDKFYPQILKGAPDRVAIVEGGVDAMAAQEYCRLGGIEPPTAIASGGARVSRFLGNPAVQKILADSKLITIFKDREKDGETQKITDEAHGRQRQKIEESFVGRATRPEIRFWEPPRGEGEAGHPKDIADLVKEIASGRRPRPKFKG